MGLATPRSGSHPRLEFERKASHHCFRLRLAGSGQDTDGLKQLKFQEFAVFPLKLVLFLQTIIQSRKTHFETHTPVEAALPLLPRCPPTISIPRLDLVPIFSPAEHDRK